MTGFNEFNEYQRSTDEAVEYPRDLAVLYPVLGLGSGAGRLLSEVMQMLHVDGGILRVARRDALKVELSNVLWHVARAARELDIDLADVAAQARERGK